MPVLILPYLLLFSYLQSVLRNVLISAFAWNYTTFRAFVRMICGSTLAASFGGSFIAVIDAL